MDSEQIIADLRRQKAAVEEVIAVLERVHAGAGPKREGRHIFRLGIRSNG